MAGLSRDLKERNQQLTLVVNAMKVYTDGALRTMQIQIDMLREVVGQLSLRVEELAAGTSVMPAANVLVVEEMTREQVRERVLAMFQRNERTDVEELHQAIRCDIRTLLEILDELKADGLVKAED